MSYNKNNFCNNCGKYGHSYNQCKLPIISSGIILVTKVNGKFYYLMIRRKDTLGYVDFLRGRYKKQNIYHLKHIISEMTISEKQNILTNDFKTMTSFNAHGKNLENVIKGTWQGKGSLEQRITKLQDQGINPKNSIPQTKEIEDELMRFEVNEEQDNKDLN